MRRLLMKVKRSVPELASELERLEGSRGGVSSALWRTGYRLALVLRSSYARLTSLALLVQKYRY